LADARNILVAQLKKYKLCKYCLERNGSRLKPNLPCSICRGLMLEKDAIVKKILSVIGAYQFDSFLIGAVLPTQIYEREDAMRARLKIRGKESVKSQLTRELGLGVARATGKAVDYLNPDLMITLIVDRENNVEVSAKSRPLTLRGTYTKTKSGLPQKQARCRSCEGKGCGECGGSGLSGYESVEGILAKQIMIRTGGRTPKFSWLGSEDRDSLVLGRGRPFTVRIFDPCKRKPSRFSVTGRSVSARFWPGNAQTLQAGFKVKTRLVIRCDRKIDSGELRALRSLAGSEVRFESRPGKIAAKKIYSAVPKRIDEHSFRLVLVADGGLMIKQFVGGQEYMKPNVSELLGAKCDCVTFDILAVDVGDSDLG
jgi:tRNA pseudouridine synthase 10